MNEREAFIRGIAANLYDDAPRLAFADWLDEHGEHDRAEFIRVQCELEPIRDQYEIPRAAELHTREKQLAKYAVWLGDMPKDWGAWNVGISVEFRRGFPDLLALSAKYSLEHAAAIRALHPTIRRSVIYCLDGWGERLAACAALRGLAELELACWYSDDDMKALAASPHLADLQVLVLWLGRRVDGTTDAKLCQLAVRAKAWPKLRELVLFDPEGDNEKQIKKLATSVNRSAKRKIAKYERGYPNVFPLAPDFDYGSPGRLPDGRLAFACAARENKQNENPFCGWEVQTFDPDGTRRDEVLRVPLPPELLPEDWSARRKFEEQQKKVLTEQTGFVPAFIRVKEGALGDGPYRGHHHYWDQCGYQDDPENPTDQNGEPDPNGIGGRIYDYIHNVEFVYGFGAWADKRGKVHST